MKKAGIALAAAVAAGAVIAAIGDGDNPNGPQRGEFFQTAAQLRSMGLNAANAHAAIKAQSNASDADVGDVVAKSYGRSGRDAASLRTQLVTLLIPEAGKVAAFQQWANAWCEPLTGMPMFQDCRDANNDEQGAPMCIAGVPAGYVARVQVTPGMATKLGALVVLGDGAAEIQSNGWTPCPSE